MENTPNEAPAAAPAESVATPNNNSTQPDMYGFTSEQLADMKKFFDNNGGYDKVKSRISNPTPAPVQEQKPVEPERPVEPEKPAYRAPAGSITPQEFLAQQYFGALSREEKYANIANRAGHKQQYNERSQHAFVDRPLQYCKTDDRYCEHNGKVHKFNDHFPSSLIYKADTRKAHHERVPCERCRSVRRRTSAWSRIATETHTIETMPKQRRPHRRR